MASNADLLIHRLLVIDDNPRIHEDYRKILGGRAQAKVSSAAVALFGEQPSSEGPSSTPAMISPMTAGCPIRRIATPAA